TGDVEASTSPRAGQTDGGCQVTSPLRVVIGEDDVLYREGLASLLQLHGFEVVGLARDAGDLQSVVLAERPDVVVVDIRMPPTHTTEGLAAARTIREEVPTTGVLVLSAHLNAEFALELVARG